MATREPAVRKDWTMPPPRTCEKTMTSNAEIAARAKKLEAALARLPGCPHQGPVTAVDLAPRLWINATMSHESIRRRVREAVVHARETLGLRICANGDGYWLARSSREWQRYQEHAHSKARFAFVRARKRQERVTDRMNEQGMLFGRRQVVGW